MIPADLVTQWRTEAATLRARYADERGAQLFELHAHELEGALADGQDEVLNLTEAAHESGYTADHLSRLINDGTIPNAGRKHAPGIRRRDLPLKPGRVARARTDIPSIGGRTVRSPERRQG